MVQGCAGLQRWPWLLSLSGSDRPTGPPGICITPPPPPPSAWWLCDWLCHSFVNFPIKPTNYPSNYACILRWLQQGWSLDWTRLQFCRQICWNRIQSSSQLITLLTNRQDGVKYVDPLQSISGKLERVRKDPSGILQWFWVRCLYITKIVLAEGYRGAWLKTNVTLLWPRYSGVRTRWASRTFRWSSITWFVCRPHKDTNTLSPRLIGTSFRSLDDEQQIRCMCRTHPDRVMCLWRQFWTSLMMQTKAPCVCDCVCVCIVIQGASACVSIGWIQACYWDTLIFYPVVHTWMCIFVLSAPPSYIIVSAPVRL